MILWYTFIWWPHRYWSISVPHPPPPYKFLSPLVISFALSLSLPARLSFYLFLSHLVSGNRIEARQWIVTRHLSCFTPFCGVKYDKMKFHEFFCVSNFFSFSPVTPSLFPLSLSHPVSLPISLSHSCLSIFLSPIPVVSLSYSHSRLPVYLSLTPVSPSPSPWLSLFHPLSLFLSSSLPPCLSFSVVLSLSPSKEREHKIIL